MLAVKNVRFLCYFLLLGSGYLRGQVSTLSCYPLDKPALLVALPAELNEISGMSRSPRANELLAVQDEDGIVYRLSLEDGQILARIPFHKPGDYEGITIVDEDIWVLKSSGTLYCIQDETRVLKFKSEVISKEEDAEGLTYDAAQHRLLIACKGAKAGTAQQRNIYAFDLASQRFLPEPVMFIRQADFTSLLDEHQQAKWYEKLSDFLIGDEDDFGLGPSALAIHPITQAIFVLSSRGNLLLELSPSGELQNFHRFKKEYFPQAEGLFFLPDATMFISTEARGSAPARIYRIPYNQDCPEPIWND